MAKAKKSVVKSQSQKEIDSYEHKGSDRVSIPQVGLVKPETDPDTGKKKKYAYDPHLDPQLQWAGKAEHTSFEVPTASLHIHERIDPRRIVESVRAKEDTPQLSLFETEKKPLREAVEFYKHKENWSNRLIAGDSLLVMNSLLEKEGMAGKVQMVYFDPPYGIKYGSNFQPFINKRDVTDGKDDDLSSEPEMLKAFRDTWELGIHSYLNTIRDRLLLSKELLSNSGSIFVQISDENLHFIRVILDEIFGRENHVVTIPFRKKLMPLGSTLLENMYDFIICYAKDKINMKYHHLWTYNEIEGKPDWNNVQLIDGTRRKMTKEEIYNHKLLPQGARVYKLFYQKPVTYSKENDFEILFNDELISPPKNWCWMTNKLKMEYLISIGRLEKSGNTLSYVLYHDDFPYMKKTNVWNDTMGASIKKYVVQTSEEVVKRTIMMSTDPGDLILDITCGSGTTASVCEEYGRRWITCDSSRIAITIAKQRILTGIYPYFELLYPSQGVGSGFKYKAVSRKSLKTIVNNQPDSLEILYDEPIINRSIIRVAGPFTVEAVPAPTVLSLEDTLLDEADKLSADKSIIRTGETKRQDDWREELLRTGVRAKGGAKIEFSRVEPIQGTTYLQAEAETKEANPKKVLVCFGPEHAPLEQRLVELALEEAGNTKPKPDMILFCAFQFDEEASKDIDETNWPGVSLLKAQMNMDLQTDDLKKGNRSSESFWLIGQPDIELIKVGEGKVQISVNGFDYYNPKTGEVESGGKDKIAMWMLDHNYDGRSLLPSQVFLPLSGAKEGWSTLAKNLKAEIDEDKMEAYSGTVSLPFVPGKQVAVKIIDDRGIESLKIIRL